MENQHREITVYRELSQAQIDLMNEIKAKGKELGELIDQVSHHSISIQDEADYNEAHRWTHEAKTTLQTGLMQLTRAVTTPSFF